MQIPCCVAQWTIWHFCPHTERALLIIYCPTIVNYGHGLGKNQMPLEWIGLDWSGVDWIGLEWWTGVKWSLAGSIFLSFFLGDFRWGFEPVERHSIWGATDGDSTSHRIQIQIPIPIQIRFGFGFGFGFRFGFGFGDAKINQLP